MIKPYVYRCEHKTTGRFYIGYRKANTVPAVEDLGVYYFTSCSEVSNNFNEYKYEILSEYTSSLMAYEVEQALIYELRHSDLLINKNYKTSNHITLDPKPVYPKSDYYADKKKNSHNRKIGPRKRSDTILRSNKGRWRQTINHP